MTNEVIESLIRDAFQMGISTFSWQGGEPTLMGLDFFKKVVELQIRYAPRGAAIANALQTNGTLLDEQWAAFLAEYSFLVGLSIDGPKKFHDSYRRDSRGKYTHSRVMRAAEILKSSRVEFNALSLINNINVKSPNEVYEFFLDNEIHYLQFIPCIEPGGGGKPAPFSVTPEDFGEFLVAAFDRWVEDFPGVSIRDFDSLLMLELGQRPGTCTASERCGDYVPVMCCST